MNPLLKQKLDELDITEPGECWYFPRHRADFINVCYIISKIKLAKENGFTTPKEIEDFVSKEINEENKRLSSKGITLSSGTRITNVGEYYGLVSHARLASEKEPTATFTEITNRCKGEFENTRSYQDIVNRQIEKIYLSSSIDRESASGKARSEFRLHPILLLYKILLELGIATGTHEVSITEYRTFIVTTKQYTDFLDTLLLIKLYRDSDDSEVENKLQEYIDKSNNFNHLLSVIPYLENLHIENNKIKLNLEKLVEVTQKVVNFERKLKEYTLDPNIYLDFLGSTKSLYEVDSLDNTVDSQNMVRSDNANYTISKNMSGKNILLYGAPGVGKSHLIETQYCSDPSKIERVVFHPDYMNTDFIGQILPKLDGIMISYKFKAGPFTKILKNAIEDTNGHYYLIIEEINRGNAPAIFGEIFQLLDRDSDGISKYAISNQDISEYINDEVDTKIRIPSNLTILATMNTADQNVFTLDTAFQRRWQMQMIENNIDKCSFKDTKILDTSVTWGVFNTLINQHILDNSGATLSSEDKRLGAYFISEDVLTQELDDQTEHIFFSEKVIKYLWDDVYKFNREQLFDSHYQSLEQVINDFASLRTDKRFNIFNKELATKLSENEVLQLEPLLDE